jgi:hypothetical protein
MTKRTKSQFFKKNQDRMVADPVKIGVLGLLFVAFLFVPRLSTALGHSLDSLPMRLAAVIIILASVSYDKYVSLGLFLVITATYIKHHHYDLMGLSSTGTEVNASVNPYEIPIPGVHVKHGGHADESYETADFTPQKEDQDDEFTKVGESIDEKHVLVSETLGSRAQSIFNDDMKHAEALAMGNRNGASD